MKRWFTDLHKDVILFQIMLEEFVAEGQATGAPRLILTAAVAAGAGTIELAYEIEKICK